MKITDKKISFTEGCMRGQPKIAEIGGAAKNASGYVTVARSEIIPPPPIRPELVRKNSSAPHGKAAALRKK